VKRLDTHLVAARIAEAAIRKALGLPYSLDKVPPSLKEAAEQATEEISKELVLVDERGILRCGLCGKGPFTRKGLYLHLRRVHIDAIEDYAKRIFEEKLWQKQEKETAVNPVMET
jgi:hypothetical protein